MKKLACVIAVAGLIGTPAFAADVYSWTGFYFGVNAGWSWGKAETTINVPSPGVPALPANFNDTTHPEGAIGGVQIGYNWQGTPNWVFGLEADIQASGENATGGPFSQLIDSGRLGDVGFFTLTDSVTHHESIDWFGTVRGRVGYVFWPTTMFYATGGFAYGGLTTSVANSQTFCVNGCGGTGATTTSTFEGTSIRTGWTVGAGFEGFAVDRRVTWKAEYLYLDLGTANYSWSDPTFGIITVSSKFTDHIFRVGLNWHLN